MAQQETAGFATYGNFGSDENGNVLDATRGGRRDHLINEGENMVENETSAAGTGREKNHRGHGTEIQSRVKRFTGN